MPLDLSAFRHRGPMFRGHIGTVCARECMSWGFWLLIDPELELTGQGEVMLAALRIECTWDVLAVVTTRRIFGRGAMLRHHRIWGLRWRFACDLPEINRRRLALVR